MASVAIDARRQKIDARPGYDHVQRATIVLPE